MFLNSQHGLHNTNQPRGFAHFFAPRSTPRMMLPAHNFSNQFNPRYTQLQNMMRTMTQLSTGFSGFLGHSEQNNYSSSFSDYRQNSSQAGYNQSQSYDYGYSQNRGSYQSNQGHYYEEPKKTYLPAKAQKPAPKPPAKKGGYA